MKPTDVIGDCRLFCGDALEVLRTLKNNSVDVVLTDPPYFKVKAEAWDWQWGQPEQFLRWLKKYRDEWHRVLKPNGSLYCFASPRMAARVEVLIAGRFEVLNRIRWQKDEGWAKRQCKEEQRAFFPASEDIIFAEHYGADNIAKGEAGYAAKCDELRGFVFEPLRAYLAGERDRAGWTTRGVAEAFQRKTGSRTVTGMAGHWFERVQWTLPTEENYLWLRELFAGDYLRREYEDLRRPFTVSSDVPYTDVWTFPTVQARKAKHPCQKPLAMIRHMVRCSSRAGAVVLDCFMGSGTTGMACLQMGRSFIGIEKSETYYRAARRRLVNHTSNPGFFPHLHDSKPPTKRGKEKGFLG